MVYKPSSRLQVRFKDDCSNVKVAKRPLNVGSNIEQKPWSPTKRRGVNLSKRLIGKPSYKIIPPLLGPNVVDSKKRSAPAYSIGRIDIRCQKILNEGPAKYNVSGIYNKGAHRPPAFTIKSRTSDIKKWLGPAPSRYEITSALKATIKTTPAYTFGKRPAIIKTLRPPAPNIYTLPPTFGTAKESQIKAAPAFSIAGREKPRQIPVHVLPGPGQYEDNSKMFCKQLPKYSMHIKHKIISDEHMKPGPGAYCAERLLHFLYAIVHTWVRKKLI
ncbi:uncharacterized protein LOC142224183 isoform X2 [Haematobia irritans]|uniref:uncharacterized protein LOC142224183 isoform X2 n=1 Tax=Haematobia irritans TaxID=7368 RepID=UPI003F4F7C13